MAPTPRPGRWLLAAAILTAACSCTAQPNASPEPAGAGDPEAGAGFSRTVPAGGPQAAGDRLPDLAMLPLAKAPAADRTTQAEAFETFRREYNEERPHETLGQDTPADHYRPSLRQMPTRPPEPSILPASATSSFRKPGRGN